MAVVAPIKKRIDHHGFGHEGSAVSFVERAIGIIEAVREHCFIPIHLAFNCPRIGIEQQFRRTTATAVSRSPGSMNAEAVTLTRNNVRQVAVPAKTRCLGKVATCLIPLFIEQTELDSFGYLGENRKISTGAVIRRAERIIIPRPNLHYTTPTRCFRMISRKGWSVSRCDSIGDTSILMNF